MSPQLTEDGEWTLALLLLLEKKINKWVTDVSTDWLVASWHLSLRQTVLTNEKREKEGGKCLVYENIIQTDDLEDLYKTLHANICRGTAKHTCLVNCYNLTIACSSNQWILSMEEKVFKWFNSMHNASHSVALTCSVCDRLSIVFGLSAGLIGYISERPTFSILCKLWDRL